LFDETIGEGEVMRDLKKTEKEWPYTKFRKESEAIDGEN